MAPSPKEIGIDDDWSEEVDWYDDDYTEGNTPDEEFPSSDSNEDDETRHNDHDRDREFAPIKTPADADGEAARDDGSDGSCAYASICRGTDGSVAEDTAIEAKKEQVVTSVATKTTEAEEVKDENSSVGVQDDENDDDAFEELAPDADDATRSALAALAFDPESSEVDPASSTSKVDLDACDDSSTGIENHEGWKVATTDLYGGGGGRRFNDTPRPNRRIVNIAINSAALIDGITVLYSDGAATKHGGEGGGWHNFPLEEGEYVVGATVRHGRFVQSLTLWTNLGRELGPCGEGGWFVLGMGRVEEVRIEAPVGHALVGVHGREGLYIDGIGFHWAPLPTPFAFPGTDVYAYDGSGNENKEWKVVMTDLYGGRGGGRFNDLPRPDRRIVNISINAGALVDGISTIYTDGAVTKHGGEGGGWHNFPLEDGEYVVGATVRHGRFVQSLTLWTNLGRELGPCGEGGFVLGMGRVKEIQVKAPVGHALVGLHGREGLYLDGIGFHWAPLPALSKS